MSTPKKSFFRGLLLVMAPVALAVFAVTVLPQVSHAVTVENVGATLGLGSADLKETVINIIRLVLGLLGLIAVIIIMYGGFLWLTARGSEDKIDKAKRTLINGVIGLVIILLAWAIVLFVQRFITNATNTASAASCTTIGQVQGCVTCVDTAPIGDGQGEWQPNGSCIPQPGTEDWQAISQTPGLDATNVKLCTAAMEIFGGLSIPADNNASAGSYTVNELDTNGNVVGTVTGSTTLGTDHTATFMHPQDFKPTTLYEVLRNGFASSSSPALPLTLPPQWRFTTGTEGDDTPPTVSTVAPTGTINCLKPNLDVAFSEPMLPLSVHVDNITVTPTPASGAKLTGLVMTAPDTFTVTFDQPLDPSTTYTIRLNADTDVALYDSSTGGKYIKGFKDMCVKNALDGNGNGTAQDTPTDDYTWTFTTANTTTIDCTPKISGIESTAFYGNNAADAQQALTITGENFGITGTGVLFPGTSAFATAFSGATSSCFNTSAPPGGYRPKQANSVACIPAGGWTSTQITTLVPAGLTPLVTGPVTGGAVDGSVIVQKSQSSPPSNPIDIQSPHIDWVSPGDGRVGTFVTIGGTHFGAVAGRVLFRKTDGTEITGTIPACAGTNGWTEDSASPDKRSQIIVQVPTGFNVNELANIQVEHSVTPTYTGATGRSNLYRFTVNDVARPGLCSITPQCHNTGGGTVAVAGEGLGTSLAAIQSYYIPNTTGQPTTNGTLSNLNSGAGTLDSRAQSIGNDTYLFQLTVAGQATNPLNYKIPCLPAPAVVQDAACNPPSTMPSPNPTPNATGVCRNLRVSARFNQSMTAADLNNATNVVMRRCDNQAAFSCAAPQPVTVTAVAGTYSQANDQITITPSTALTGDSWYEVTLKGATIHSAPAGVAVGADYTWHFRVKPGTVDCTADAVAVIPPIVGPAYTGQSWGFTAFPASNSCTLLTSTGSTFTWQSSDDTLAPDSPPGGTIITINPPNVDDTLITVVPPGTNNGTATLTATTGGKSGTAQLTVQRNYCDTDADCQGRQNSRGEMCSGAECNVATHQCKPWVRELQSGGATGLSVFGLAGNLMNVRGCFFGNSKGSGEVTFAFGSTTVNGSFALCGPAGWTDDDIRVQAMPETNPPATPASAWNVRVLAGNGLVSPNSGTYTISTQCTSNTGGTITVPASGVPIVCNATPPAAKEGNAITLNGKRLTGPGGQQSFFTESAPQPANFNLTGGGTFTSTQATNVQVPAGTGIPSGQSTGAVTAGTRQVASGAYCIATPVAFNVSCNQNSECSTGCCQTNICRPTSSCYGLIASASPAAGTLACRNSVFQVNFTQAMQTSTVNATNIYLYNTVTSAHVPARLDNFGNAVSLTPSTPLANGTYRMFVKGGVNGVASAAGTYLSTDFEWPVPAGVYTVNATSTICQIARTEIQPADDLFTCSGDSCTGDVQSGVPGNQHAYSVQAYDANNVSIALQTWAWTQGDSGGSGGPTNVYTQGTAGAVCPGNATSAAYCSQSLNVPSGQEALSVQVTGASGSGTGTATANVRSFLCAKPWPAAPDPWPFRDPAIGAEPTHNFTMAYCGDDVGNVTLRLPAVGGLTSGPNQLRKEYFLFAQDTTTGQNTGDAIGVRVNGNPGDLSPDRWYRATFGRPPSGSSLDVDGYPALREGRTVYVSATSCVDAACSSIYPNIYVFSYSDKAKPETIRIFEQLLQNLRFNAQSSLTPAFQTALRQDTKRVHAYNEVVYGLQSYLGTHSDYPKLESGSYVPGLTVTAWPSWQETLGQALGVSLPKDPGPLWDEALCPDPNTEQATCWNQTAKIFTFPSNNTNPPESHAILFRYGAGLYGTMEQNTPRNSIVGLTQSPGLAGTNICPGPSQCFGFNLRIAQSFFNTIETARTYSPASADGNNPVVAINAPAAGNLQGTVDVVVTATDNQPGDSGIASVVYSVTNGGGQVVNGATVTSPASDGKYHWSWNTRTLLNASYTLTVTATDKASRFATATRAYTLTNPPGDGVAPTINPFSPGSGYVFTGSSDTVSATATEPAAPNNSGVAKIEFYLGTSLLVQAPATTCTTGCPGSFSRSSNVSALIQQFPNGPYTYSVVAYDVAGNTAIRQASVTVQRPSETTPPTVTITVPTTTISGSFTNVIADASDGQSGMDRVEFYVDGAASPTLTDFSQPFGFSWSHGGYVNNSSHTIRAVAYDRAGNQAQDTNLVTYSTTAGPDTERPQITNVVPAAGASLTNTVTLGATLTDNVSILRAELRIDGTLIPLTGGSYFPITPPNSYGINYQWNTLPEIVGPHTITFTAYDTANNVTTVSRNVTVDNQITMTISQPTAGATVHDPPVPVHIDVTRTCRSDQQLASVVFYLDNDPSPFTPQPVGSCTNGQCSYTWDTLATASNGSHVLKAIGTDSTGCKGGSKVNVAVANSVNDVTPPIIDSFSFNGTNWNTGSPVYINAAGTITVVAHDPPPGASGIDQISIAVNGANLPTACSGNMTCTATWNPPEGTNYTVTVGVSDVAGNNAATQTQVVNVDKTPPVAAWQSPANGTVVYGFPYPTLQATASDALSGIASVVFYDSTETPPLLSPPGTGSGGVYSWNNWDAPVIFGNHQLYAEAFDRAGNRTPTATVTITFALPDTTPPTVSIITPATDNEWHNGTVLLEASASDSGVGMRDVEFFVNGASLGPPVTGSGTYQFNWDSTSGAYPNSPPSYNVNVRACDNNNNCATPGSFRYVNIANSGASGGACGPVLLCSGATPFCCVCLPPSISAGPPYLCSTGPRNCPVCTIPL